MQAIKLGRFTIHGRSFRSRVARRIFSLFVLCALVPVVLFALFSFRSVSSQLESEARAQLREASKAAGMVLIERLTLLDATLAAIQEELSQGSPARLEQLMSGRFLRVEIVDAEDAHPLAPATDDEIRHLGRGRGLLRVVAAGERVGAIAAEGDTARLFLVRRHVQSGGQAYAVGEIDPAYLWQPDTLRSQLILAVAGARGQRVFASVAVFPEIAGADGTQADPASGPISLDWEIGGERYLGEAWTLFLRSLFYAPSWKLAHYQPEADVLVPMRHFQLIFVLVTVLSLFAVMLLSLVQIRRSLGPIETLHGATRRVAEGDYDAQVSIATDDEFRDLGESFNHMTRNIADLRQNLESKVRERTRELAEALEELRLTQATLVHQEKMASIGHFVAGVAHEINNPMNFIEGNLDFIKTYAQSMVEVIESYEAEIAQRHPELSERLAEIRRDHDLDYVLEDLESVLAGCDEGTKRTTSLVQDLRTFSRLDQAEYMPMDLQEALDSTLNLLRSRLQPFRIERAYQDIPPVECLGSQINQVLMNLIANAADASEEGGRIVIRTSCPDGDKAVVEVEDEGTGMSEEVLKHIFDPFFTTKPVGEGTGLGLSVSYGVVERHSGSLSVRSAPGEGSCFRMELPLRGPEEPLEAFET